SPPPAPQRRALARAGDPRRGARGALARGGGALVRPHRPLLGTPAAARLPVRRGGGGRLALRRGAHRSDRARGALRREAGPAGEAERARAAPRGRGAPARPREPVPRKPARLGPEVHAARARRDPAEPAARARLRASLRRRARDDPGSPCITDAIEAPGTLALEPHREIHAIRPWLADEVEQHVREGARVEGV